MRSGQSTPGARLFARPVALLGLGLGLSRLGLLLLSLLFGLLCRAHHNLPQCEEHLGAVIHAIEHIFAQSVVQAQACHSDDVVHRHLLPALEGNKGGSGPVADDIAANTVDVDHGSELADLQPDITWHVHLGQELPGLGELLPQLILISRNGLYKASRVLLVGDPIQGQLRPLVHIDQRADVDAETEPIQKLRPELSLGWVSGPNHDKLGRVHDGHTLTLDRILPTRSRIQDHVHQPIVKQVDLVHVQYTPVGLGQKSRLVRLDTLTQRLLNVNGSADPVLGGTERQLDQRRLCLYRRQLLTTGVPLQHIRPHQLAIRRTRVEVVTRHHINLREEVDNGAHGHRLPATTVSHDQHTANARVHHVEEERQLHI
mmetsp:Transcript_8563/g.23185  ORF Transcript_8563/g.23185 Transcript_8563/m.23185 type:complete len:372 (-) Transcript_8563:393-1508(-)